MVVSSVVASSVEWSSWCRWCPPWWLPSWCPPWWLPSSCPPWWLVSSWWPRGSWWHLLTSSPAYSQPGTLADTHVTPQCGGARRRNPSFKGIKMKGYCSIYQLFKLSSWVALYKSFIDRNLIKTLFSIDYRGYFIIHAIHSTINYSYFLHITDRKHMENQ